MAGIMEKMYGNQGGGSGGDSHNKGSFLTPAALREAYPTAEPGDFAIVESTDTIWVWDNDGSDWKDADQKGQVTSVNGQTGDVVIPNELPQMSYNTRGKYLKNVWGASGGETVWSDDVLLANYSSSPNWSVAAGSNSQASSQNAAVYGVDAKGNQYDVTVVGCEAEATANSAVILGYKAKVTAFAAIQLGSRGTNSEIGTLCVSSYYNNAFVNYKLLDSDGTIPEARLADTTNSQEGDVLTLDSNGNAVWQAGGDPLPSQTGHSGHVLTTDGFVAGWVAPTTITFRTWEANE